MWISKTSRAGLSVINQISRVCGIVALIFLLIMMLMTVADVCLRYIFNAPILGSFEITEYLMIIAGFLGVAWCAVQKGHVKVDLIVSHLPLRARTIIESITLILAMTVAPIVAWQGFAQARYAQSAGDSSSILKIPASPFYVVVGFSYALLSVVLLTLIAELIIKAVKK